MSTPKTQWGNQARGYARDLADAFPGRGSATREEAAAAEHVRKQLAALGIDATHTQPFQGQRSIWLFLAQAFGLALVGHAAFWILRPPLGDYLALFIAIAAFGLSFFLLWRKFTFKLRTLSNLPQGASQNVIAVLPPDGEILRRVVLLAHLDSHRAVWVFAHPLIARAYSFLAPLVLWGVLVAPVLYTLDILTGVPVFGWLALLLALIHFITWFTGVTADLGPYSPGANDNASAVGSLLALAERLLGESLAHTEVWLVFTGCEESGGDGMLHFLAEYGEKLKDALFIDLELVGIGDRLVYLENEGMLRWRSMAPAVRHLVQQAAQQLAVKGQSFSAEPALQPQAFPATDAAELFAAETALQPEGISAVASPPIIQPLRGSLRGAYTEMNIAWEHGFQGVCLMVLSSTMYGLPQWHHLTDTSQNYHPQAFELVHDFVWELLHVRDKAG